MKLMSKFLSMVRMNGNPSLNAQLSPIIDGLRPIPPVAWIPISILWLGVTDTQQYFIIWIGAFFPIMLNTTAGVEQIDMTLKRAALSLGADAKGMFEVVLLGAMPSIFFGDTDESRTRVVHYRGRRNGLGP